MVEFKTEYNKDIIKKACKYSICQIIIPMAIVALGFFGLAILSFANKHILVGLIWLFASFGYIPVVYYITYITQLGKYNRMYLESNTSDVPLIDTYQFKDKAVVISTDLGTKNVSSEKTDYDFFIKVIERKNDFIFFKTKLSIIIIPKSSLTQGTIEELETILKEKYGEDFKKKCR